MTTDKEWHRPKKPYTVNNTNPPKTYTSSNSKPNKPKNVVIPAKNNENNKVLHAHKLAGDVVKIYINNTLCSDTLAPSYEGVIKNFDDFTIHLVSPNGEFLINKSSITLIEF